MKAVEKQSRVLFRYESGKGPGEFPSWNSAGGAFLKGTGSCVGRPVPRGAKAALRLGLAKYKELIIKPLLGLQRKPGEGTVVPFFRWPFACFCLEHATSRASKFCLYG